MLRLWDEVGAVFTKLYLCKGQFALVQFAILIPKADALLSIFRYDKKIKLKIGMFRVSP